MEIPEEPLHLDLGGSPRGSGQPMRDLLAQDIVGGQPGGIEVIHVFQPRTDCGERIGSISTEEPQDAPRGVSGDHRIKDGPPAPGTVDVAIAQDAASSMLNWLNKKFV